MTCELHKTSRESSFCISQVCREPEFVCVLPDFSLMRKKNHPNLVSGKKGKEKREERRSGRPKKKQAGRGKEKRILGHYCFYTVSFSLAKTKFICIKFICILFINSPTGLSFCGIFKSMTVANLLCFLLGCFKDPHISKYSIKTWFVTLLDPLKWFTL